MKISLKLFLASLGFILSTASAFATITELNFNHVIYTQNMKRNFSFKQIPAGKKAVIIYFLPGCPHCQHQAENIQKDLAHFKPYQVFFVSHEPMPEIDHFFKIYGLAGKRNFASLYDQDRKLMNSGEFYGVPSILILNKKHEVVTRLESTQPAATLLNELKTADTKKPLAGYKVVNHK